MIIIISSTNHGMALEFAYFGRWTLDSLGTLSQPFKSNITHYENAVINKN